MKELRYENGNFILYYKYLKVLRAHRFFLSKNLLR